MSPNPYEQYRATRVGTATSAELVTMLYQGVLRFTQRAIHAVEQGNVADAHTAFIRAQDIVSELTAGLNLEEGGEVARNLLRIYDYAYRRLVEANCRKSTAPAQEVVTIFRELLDTWQMITARAKGGAPSVSAVELGVVA